MEVLKLPTKIRERVIKVENEIKEKYLEIVRNMPTDELRKFNKFKYRDLMAIDMLEALENTVAEQIIKDQCHYMTNALNNESQAELGKRRKNSAQQSNTSPRQTRQSSNMKENQNVSLDPIDAERLSLSMNDMFITKTKQETCHLNRSMTTVSQLLNRAVTMNNQNRNQ